MKDEKMEDLVLALLRERAAEFHGARERAATATTSDAALADRRTAARFLQVERHPYDLGRATLMGARAASVFQLN
jgi:hypothetical protein